ncbi:unnamed protein product (macronuclear) [Paramecium tetraurelia]|uniref:Transmembrane protein n=1 Tax=Paramecium tetraurelia TaxID=5888 RepID=A0DXC1_PARTE|nr:uncharacterized protein GSPATT00021321001 [Paramecium tetraurelia]CAK87688.1 unnamed protein product [Paramecium tetraurelia]|eukprot:XP_001455085.1 hypothetical protein (macronuclear) [Paramecium tetraurelia strain d4-2]
MLPILICSLLVIEVLSDQIYPAIEKLKVQLENDGWIDCESKELIQASTCSGDDLLWLECYLVPENGLCSRQNILTNTGETLTYTFTFYKPTFQSTDIVINNQKNTGSVTIQDDLGRVTIQQQSTSSSIKINQKGAYFTGLTISKDCNPNCKSCVDGFCNQCNDNDYLYNYNCQSNDCDLSIINNNFITSSTGAIQNGQYVVSLVYNFKIAFCLIPKVYLTKGLKDSTILKILDQNQVSYISTSGTPNSLQITLSLDEVQNNCQQFETTSAYVYQCYIGVALTSSKITQFLAIIIGQISVERATQNVEQFTQAVSITGDSNGTVGPVFVVSETVNQEINADKKKLTVTQSILDPQFSNYQIIYMEAYIIQNGKTYTLNLDYSIQKGASTTFGFIWDDSNFNPSLDFQSHINSLAEPASRLLRRRQLEVSLKREQLQVMYQVQSQNIFQSTKLNKKNSWSEFIVVVAGLIGMTFIIYLSKVVYNHYKKKEEKNQTQIPKDEQKMG